MKKEGNVERLSLPEQLCRVERKIDNLEELLKILLVQNVMQDIPKDVYDSSIDVSESDEAGKVSVYIQYHGYEIEVEELVVRAKAQFFMETGYPILVTDLRIYIKPEDRVAYYVINNRYLGQLSFVDVT